MALSLSIGTSQLSQSVSGNYTTLRVNVNISWTSGSWDHNGYTKYVTIDGSTYYFSSEKVNPNRTSSGSQTLYSVDVNIPHNSDGTKSVSIYAYVKTASSSGTVTASASPTLSTIPRTSPATLSASSVTTGGSFTVYTNRYAAFTHTIKVTLGSKTITKTGVANSVAITIPRDWATALPNTTSGTATVVCTTDGIGSVTKNITVNVNSADIPTLTKVTATPHNENSIVAGWGIYLQGYSAIQIAFNTMAGVQGSTITGYKIKYGNAEITASPYRTPVINLSGAQKVYCYVKDSRGRWSAAKEVNVDFLSYAKPSLSGADSYRSDSGGARQEQKGTYITAFAKAIFSSCNNKNSATLKCRYGLKSGIYGNYESMTSETKKITGGGNIAVSKSYKVEILLTDALSNTDSAEFEISTKKVAISIMDTIRGAAIGKIAEKEGTLEVDFDTEVNGGITAEDYLIDDATLQSLWESVFGGGVIKLIDWIYPVGSYYWTSKPINPSDLWGGTWVQVKDKFILAAGAKAVGATGGEENHNLTIAEMPKHDHKLPIIIYSSQAPALAGVSEYNAVSYSSGNNGVWTKYMGDGEAHNNMPPYEVAYCWKRTA